MVNALPNTRQLVTKTPQSSQENPERNMIYPPPATNGLITKKQPANRCLSTWVTMEKKKQMEKSNTYQREHGSPKWWSAISQTAKRLLKKFAAVDRQLIFRPLLGISKLNFKCNVPCGGTFANMIVLVGSGASQTSRMSFVTTLRHSTVRLLSVVACGMRLWWG